MDNKSIISLMTFAIMSVLLIANVIASGVTTPAWEGVLSPGESKTIYFGLQNGIGDSNITIRASISKGAEVASFIDKNTDYFVPLGKDEIKVPVKISIPKEAQVGASYQITLSFQTIGAAGGVPLAIGQAFDSSTAVTIVEKTASTQAGKGISNSLIILIVAILLLIIIIYIIKRQNSQSK